jgi:hypothetical protein
MPLKYDIVIPQRDPLNTKFLERVISGSGLILQTDESGVLVGSTNLPPFNLSGSAISASGLFVQGPSTFQGPINAQTGSFTSIIFNPSALPPVTSNSYGVAGELRTDDNFLYLHLNGKWRRAPFNLFY